MVSRVGLKPGGKKTGAKELRSTSPHRGKRHLNRPPSEVKKHSSNSNCKPHLIEPGHPKKFQKTLSCTPKCVAPPMRGHATTERLSLHMSTTCTPFRDRPGSGQSCKKCAGCDGAIASLIAQALAEGIHRASG
jgi:hypothetical protein